MMMKQIPHPDLKSATKLTPLQMNAIHFAKKRTVLSADALKKENSENKNTDK